MDPDDNMNSESPDEEESELFNQLRSSDEVELTMALETVAKMFLGLKESGLSTYEAAHVVAAVMKQDI